MAPVLFLAGAPGTGKTSTAAALASRQDQALLIELDRFRQLMVRGLVEPSAGWTEETTRQFILAHTAAGRVARTYSEAGTAVIVEHCTFPFYMDFFLQECPWARTLCLRCDLEVNLERNRRRRNKSFNPDDIAFFVHELGQSLPEAHAGRGWPVLDTTAQSLDQTVESVEAFWAGL